MYVASINPVALGALFVQLSGGAKKVQRGFSPPWHSNSRAYDNHLSRFIYPQKFNLCGTWYSHLALQEGLWSFYGLYLGHMENFLEMLRGSATYRKD